MTTIPSTYRYVQIADDLRGQISEGVYAESGKLPAEQEIADSFGVSRLTLRKAVDLLVDEGLVVRHRGKGTFVGSAPDDGQATSQVVFVGQIGAHLWSSVYASLAGALQDRGARLDAYTPPTSKSPDPAFAAWLASVGDAPDIVCQSEYWRTIEAVAVARDCRVVVIDMPTERPPFHVPQVVADTYRAGELATQFLIDQGYERIAFFGFGSDPAPGPGFFLPFPSNLAYSGYMTAMRCAALPTDGLAMGGYGEGAELQAQFLAYLDHLGSWPDAIVCQQDYKSRDILAVAAAQGVRIPDDVSLVSIGDTPWAEAMMPALTSVNLQPAGLAHLALQVLTLPAASTAPIYRLEPTLVIRESTRPTSP